MLKYIGKRFLQLIPIIIGITFMSFALMYSVADDAVDVLYENAGGEVTEQVKDKMRKELGLDRPFFVQYADWLVSMVKGDMGTSYISGKKVFDTFVSKLPNTVYLTASSLLLTIVISIPFGIIAAVRQDKLTDYIIRFFSFIGNSMPGFFISLLLILIFAVKLKWFSAIGNEGVKSLVLPSATLAVSMSAKYTRQVRGAVLEELSKDYVTAAHLRGIKESVILYKSVLRTAMITITTLLALSIGSLLGGTAIVETIFMWDGVGKLAVDSIMMRDYPMILAYVVWLAIIYVIINLIADIIYHALDPRIRLLEEG